MAPMKSFGLSHRKGKKAVYDPPVKQETGEEAVYSESDHSDEEKAQHDPDSEYTPLIDPWYDVHPSFPKIPSDYVPPSSSHVWLTLCERNINASWASMSSSISNLVICRGISLRVSIHFEFGSGTALG